MKLSCLFCGALFLSRLAWAADGPLSPTDSLKQFHLEPGLRIDVVAAEPQVVSPVAIAFDEQGRLYVAEDRGYPVGPGEGKPPVGRIALLEDKDGDGYYETRTEFATGLTFPNGVMPWRGGVLVTCAPDVYFLKDTDGDGKADVRQVVLTGYSTNATTQLRVSHPTLGLDNWVYVTSGLTGGKVTSPQHPDRPAVQFTRSDSRFDPDSYDVETTGGAGQFGLSFDDFGHKFVTSNRNPLQEVVLSPRYLKRNPYFAFSDMVQEVSPFGEAGKVHPLSKDSTTASFMPSLMATPHAGTFTSACGTLIFRGDALTPAHMGNAFICEPAQNLVQRQIVSPSGSTFSSHAADDKADFLATEDSWFRPVFAAVGPDGALYICDMYRRVIDHPQYLPENMRATADFESGKDKGRIYRIARTDRPANRLHAGDDLHMSDFTSSALCELLSAPNGWVRDTARRMLLERQEPMAKGTLRSTAVRGRTPMARAAALHLLQSAGWLDEVVLTMALADADPGVRENAVQLAEPRLAKSPKLTQAVLDLAGDSNARVRFQTALSLGETHGTDIIPALAKIAARAGDDRWTRAAVLSSVGSRGDDLLAALLTEAPATGAPDPALIQSLGQVMGAGQPTDRLLVVLGKLDTKSDAEWPMALLTGLAEGLRGRGIKGKESSPLLNLVAADTEPARVAHIQVQAVLDRALKIAADMQQSPSRRQAAIGLLAQSDFAHAGTVLLGLIGPQQPAELQVVAVHSLSQMSDPAVGQAFVNRERWRAYSPSVREAVVAAMMSQTRLLPALLDAMESGTVQMWALTPQRRTQLQKHRDPAIRAHAEKLFANAGGGDRMKVYEEYKTVLALKGNSTSGRAVFGRICVACHLLNGEGVAVGPDLSGVRNQPAEALLLHIIVPDYEIYPGYTSYEVETKSGESLTGLLAAETATSVTLRRALGQQDTILRSNIASISSTSLSLMPQELEKQMTKQELADLLAYLKGE